MDTPEAWNEFAHEYAEIQAESELPIEHGIVTALREQTLLPTDHVLDLASGNGRYARAIAPLATKVTLLDWSHEMLTLAADHAPTNFEYVVADWHAYHVPADLVFISQLPTLSASELSAVTHLATKAVAINHQIEQADTLLTQCFAWLHQPIPAVYQANPQLMTSYHHWLKTQDIAFKKQFFYYTRTEPVTMADLALELNQPLTASQVQAMTQTVTGQPDVHHMIDDHITYGFELLTWHTPA